MQNTPRRTSQNHPEHGGILGKLLALLLLAVIAGGVWWWFMGRYAVPDEEPKKPTEVTGVIDYVERRDMGTDPYASFDNVTRPDPRLGSDGKVPDARYLRWSTEFGKALAARAVWRGFEQGSALTDALKDQARDAHLTYLHHAQLAEYYRAKWQADAGE